MKKSMLLLFMTVAPGLAFSQSVPQLTDERTGAIVVADVFTTKCPILLPSATYANYRKAASKLLSVASVNTDLYNEKYRKLVNFTNNLSSERLAADCADLLPKIANMIPEMYTDYEAYLGLLDGSSRRQADSWSSALELFSAFANSLGQAAQSYDYSFIPMPSGRVNFGQSQQGRGTNYLVNTPGGLKQCHVASSGYILCN
ncbi:hypothetical protein [Undibacterium sp. WLHG33]|uniref:hypothetical protein n=1 Tax=Undibacterium sp. WLHG33 TaxID=3412482 RepID=UPI003C2C53C6